MLAVVLGAMEPKKTCKACGNPIEGDALTGLCPVCMMQVGLGSVETNPDDPNHSEAQPFTAPSVEDLAEIFPQLEIQALIGVGGMGAVYRAHQRDLDRPVALKILVPRRGSDPGFAERFMREARALARLSHPHIVTVYDFGQKEGLSYFIMEFVDGANLREVQKAGELSPQQALAIVPQICEALQFAHNEGVVHRDIKPENVLLDQKGRVKIADFGLAKIAGKQAPNLTLTQEGHVMGTPHYMAPEQVEHPHQVDHRADIYSLGVVFYEMLTGELPLGKFAAPSRMVQVDVRLDEVVLKTLEKRPERRYQQVSQVGTEVQTIAGSGSAAVQADTLTNKKGKEKPLLVRIAEFVYGSTFTSPLAINLTNISSLGFLGFLAFLGYAPLPGMRRCFGFSGLYGFFGLIGFAFIAESWQRHKAKRSHQVNTKVETSESSAQGTERVSEESIAEIKRDLRIPAFGLLVSGSLNLAVLCFLGVSIVLGELLQGAFLLAAPGLALFSVLLFLVLVVLWGSSCMRRLTSHRLAVDAAILAILFSVGSGIGVIFGVWALVVLSRKEVRQAFDRLSQGRDEVRTIASTVRRRLVIPALGLIVLGVLPLLGVLPFMSYHQSVWHIETFLYGYVPANSAVRSVFSFLSVICILGAGQMLRVRGYYLAISAGACATLLAMCYGIGILTHSVTNPVDLGMWTSLPVSEYGLRFLFGVWSLIVLSRKEARQAFQQVQVGTKVQTIASTAPKTHGTASPSAVALRAKPDRSAMPIQAGTQGIDEKEVSPESLAEIKRDLRIPAFGLLVSGSLNLAVLCVVAFLAGPREIAQKAPLNIALSLTLLSLLFFLVLVVLWGASCMRRLTSYRLAIDAAILAILFSWGSGLGLIFGVWALVVLSRKEVRQAFEQARISKSEVKDRSKPLEPHLSRLAVVGILWAVFFLGVAFPGLPHRLMEFAGVAVLPVSPYGYPLMFAVRLLGFTATFGTTILGWIAVTQIRRSAGRLQGLWLAVFDGILFPLLLLDAGMVWLWSLLDNEESLLWYLGRPENLFFMVLTVLLSNVLIVSWIWPKLTAKAEVPTSPARAWMQRLGFGLLAVVVVGGLVIAYCQRPCGMRDGISQESPDGLYSLEAQTRRTMRMLDGDELLYFIQLQGKGGTILQRWRIPVSTEKLTQGWQNKGPRYYSLVQHGRVEWSTDSRTVKLLVHGVEVFQSAESRLAFRIVPKGAQHQGPISAQEEAQLREALVHQGPIPGHARADYIWIPYQGQTMPSDVVTQSYRGQTYVLASNRPAEIMLPDGTWGLEHTEPSNDTLGNPSVSIRLDDPGSKRFRTLTSGNIDRSLGVTVDGMMVSAPTISTTLHRHASITGNLTRQQATDLAYGLRRGMSPGPVPPRNLIREIPLDSTDIPGTGSLAQGRSVMQASVSDRYAATLPNGIHVELLGLCLEPDEGAEWWKPDGSAMDTPAYQATHRRPSLGGLPTQYTFLAKISGAGDISVKAKIYEGVGLSSRVAPDGTVLCYVRHPDPNTSYHKDAFEKGPVEIGVAQGPWLEPRGSGRASISRMSSNLVGRDDQIIVQPPQREPSSPDMATQFWATTTSYDYEYRLVCKLNDGTTAELMQPLFRHTHTIETGGLRNSKLKTKVFIIDKPIDQIIEYELLYRTLEFVRFDEVVFKPKN